MKNVFIICLSATFAFFGCSDEQPKTIATADVNDLLGIWVSTDSNLVDLGGNRVYARDTLTFGDSLFIKGSNTSYYTYSYFGADSLILRYEGPTEIGFVNNVWPNKILFNSDKQIITINGLRKTYPYSNLNKFKKS
jgi:hypothetical protein